MAQSDAQKRWYELNKKTHSANVRKRQKQLREEHRKKVCEILESSGCLDCGDKRPIVLDFDHVRGEKKMNVSQMVHQGLRWELIAEEIAKCEIRCANCHRIKTAKQFGWTY